MSEPEISPLARRLAEENNVDWRGLHGSGAEGKVVERDVLEYLARVMAGEEAVDPTPEPVPEGMEAWPEEDVHSFQRDLQGSRRGVGLEDIQQELSASDRLDGAGGPAEPSPWTTAEAAEGEPEELDEDISEDIFLFEDDGARTAETDGGDAAAFGAVSRAPVDDLDDELLVAGDDGAGDAEAVPESVDEDLWSREAGPAGDGGLPDVFGEEGSEATAESGAATDDGRAAAAEHDAAGGLEIPDLGALDDVTDEAGWSMSDGPSDGVTAEGEPGLWSTEATDDADAVAGADTPDLFADEGEPPAEAPPASAPESAAEEAPAADWGEAAPWGAIEEPESGHRDAGAVASAVEGAAQADEGPSDDAAHPAPTSAEPEAAPSDAEPVPAPTSFTLEEDAPEPAPPGSDTVPDTHAPAIPAVGAAAAAAGLRADRLGASELPLVSYGTLLRRHLDLTALAGAQLAVSQELGEEEPLPPTAFLVRAAAKAVADAGWGDGTLGVARLDGGGVRVTGVQDAESRPFRELLAALDPDASDAAASAPALVVADMSAMDVDEAVLDVGAPVVTLGRILYDNQRGSYRSTLALSGEVVPERGARLLARIADLLDAPVRLVL